MSTEKSENDKWDECDEEVKKICANLLTYFEMEGANGAPLVSPHSLKERVSLATGIPERNVVKMIREVRKGKKKEKRKK